MRGRVRGLTGILSTRCRADDANRRRRASRSHRPGRRPILSRSSVLRVFRPLRPPAVFCTESHRHRLAGPPRARRPPRVRPVSIRRRVFSPSSRGSRSWRTRGDHVGAGLPTHSKYGAAPGTRKQKNAFTPIAPPCPPGTRHHLARGLRRILCCDSSFSDIYLTMLEMRPLLTVA